MTERSCLTIILAAGEGTRMKSDLVKVLHPVAGLPMVLHVANAAKEAGTSEIAVVIGRQAEAVERTLTDAGIAATFHEQTERLGTGHAVKAARSAIETGFDDVLVVFGDTPLLTPETIIGARAELAKGSDVVVVGFRTSDPTGYGRLLENGGKLLAIREEKEATDAEKKINFCNGGLMAFSGAILTQLLDEITNDNAKGEYYMTDAVEIANGKGLTVSAIEAPFEDALGVNSRIELAEAEAIWQQRKRNECLAAGVTMQAPETVWFYHDTEVGSDAVVEPHCVFSKGVRVASGARIRAFSHLEEAEVGEDAEIGPYARLRPGAKIGKTAKVGNFCEIKKAKVAKGAKVNHLTYVGDAIIGEGANIGAGTITCNYDGFNKHLTQIGAGAFIGSNSSLVAPVNIGDGAYVASGSVVTDDVADDAVAFGRARQTNKDGKAAELRKRFAEIKAAKSKG
ncbi:MAG: bifunctional UDP-N-acetylglucosamine diphosphorylase/glucosamine-1-phosphate N-acetyltransferase GlmU [Pseudomonadota bacterium]